MSGPMSPEQAAQYVAAEAWPNERWENRRGWAPRLITEPDMAAQEVAHALERIEQRRVWVLQAAKVLGVTTAAPVSGVAARAKGEVL